MMEPNGCRRFKLLYIRVQLLVDMFVFCVSENHLYHDKMVNFQAQWKNGATNGPTNPSDTITSDHASPNQ